MRKPWTRPLLSPSLWSCSRIPIMCILGRCLTSTSLVVIGITMIRLYIRIRARVRILMPSIMDGILSFERCLRVMLFLIPIPILILTILLLIPILTMLILIPILKLRLELTLSLRMFPSKGPATSTSAWTPLPLVNFRFYFSETSLLPPWRRVLDSRGWGALRRGRRKR